MNAAWLIFLIKKAAVQLETAGGARFRFAADVERALVDNPIQDWEAALWARGLKHRLIKLEGHFFRVGTGKRSCLSFFVRNEKGLQVGLRRESITQAATYIELITDYGYGRGSTRFETGWMDVAVFDETGKAYIYAENKASDRTLEKLCGRLCADYKAGIPFSEEELPQNDPLMKAQHIWRHRPTYFWGVSPTLRRPYRIQYSNQGFWLEPAETIPNQCEWTNA